MFNPDMQNSEMDSNTEFRGRTLDVYRNKVTDKFFILNNNVCTQSSLITAN